MNLALYIYLGSINVVRNLKCIVIIVTFWRNIVVRHLEGDHKILS